MNSSTEFLKIYEKNKVIVDDLEKISSSNLPWQKLKNCTLVVTGGTGFLATYLIKAILTANYLHKLNLKLICVARNAKKFKKIYGEWTKLKFFHFYQQDFCNELKGDFPCSDYVIHTASNASPKFYGQQPVETLLPNIFGTFQLLKHNVGKNFKKFLFFSSGSIYGNQVENISSINENNYGFLDPHDLRSSYSLSKKMAENILISWSIEYGMQVNIVRPFHTYGPGIDLNDGRVFCDFVKDIVNKNNITIKSDGSTKRCFCYLSDATIGFLLVLLKGKNRQAYNIANPSQEISVRDLAYILTKIRKDINLGVEFDKRPRGSSYLQSKLLTNLPSIEKAKIIGFCPKIDILNGFTKTVNYFIDL